MHTLKTCFMIIGALFVALQVWKFIVGPLLHLIFGLIPLALFILLIVFVVGANSRRREN